MTDEEKTREQIEEIVNNVDEPVKEEIKEEVKKEEDKPKAKPRASRAKPKQIKIVKESVVEVVEEKPEPVVEVVEVKPEPVKVDKLKQIVKCPDCKMDMTVHTLKYIHKRRGFCKADTKAEVVPEKSLEPIVQQNQRLQKML